MAFQLPVIALLQSIDFTLHFNKVEMGYTGFTMPVCLSVDGIMSTRYLQQYVLDLFHIYNLIKQLQKVCCM